MIYSHIDISKGFTKPLYAELSAYGRVVDIEVELEPTDGDHFAVAFAAVRSVKNFDRIEAVVCLLKRDPGDRESECRMTAIHESEGPRACFCPPNILDQLDPTRDVVSLSWRRRCATIQDWDHQVGQLT